ncbi:DoxX family protein [Antarcticibacterium arcticum]|uniref:DoxX family protein n=1 Tax=Antarcticibacterium arcticum TaxID=2585771 RepID=A0A5B8YG98_9FLAO|nr:DoxX family protein [Antarcticibacterium arcticum]QED36611.1 DoxX family protein [Antarcticibacterium arcticum]
MKNQILVTNTSIRILRIMLSGIFLVAGSNHLLNVEGTVNKMDKASLKGMAYAVGNPEYLVILSGIVMLLAGISLLIGFRTRYAAAILGLVLIPITITVQVGQINSLGPLFKNIAIMGGLLFFILNDFNSQKIMKPAQADLGQKIK